MWKDTTTYSQGKPRIQTAWSYSNNQLEITISKGHIYHPGKWVMHCFAMKMDTVPLKIPDDSTPEMAQKVAIDMVRIKLRNMYASLEGL